MAARAEMEPEGPDPLKGVTTRASSDATPRAPSEAASDAGITCSAASLAAGEPLAGTATQASRFLLVEVAGRWERDPVEDTPLPRGVVEVLRAFDGRVLFLRRPGRSAGCQVFKAELDDRHPEGGVLTGASLGTLDDLPELDLDTMPTVAGPLVLVCTHGRRDACCASLGAAFCNALAGQVAPDRLWQTSHQGGHRFAPSVLVLPHGTQFGRLDPRQAREWAAAVEAREIVLDAYRGRVVLSPAAQAAEVALRREQGLTALAAVILASELPLAFETPAGRVEILVEERRGPLQPASCGAEPTSQPRYSVRW